MKTMALEFLLREPLRYMDMIEPIRRNQATVLFADGSGVLIYDRPSRAHMVAGSGMIDKIEGTPELLVMHDADALSGAHDLFKLSPVVTCHQTAYMLDQPPEVMDAGFELRALDMSWHEQVRAAYHMDLGPTYLGDRIISGDMVGAFDGEKLAGFIGLHAEGSMGMLEVLPDYRRRGLGRMLIAHLSSIVMARGWTPFSQFEIGNDASRQLHAGLGFEICESEVYWLEK